MFHRLRPITRACRGYSLYHQQHGVTTPVLSPTSSVSTFYNYFIATPAATSCRLSTKADIDIDTPTSNNVTTAQAEQIRVLREDGVAPATGRPLQEIASTVWRHKVKSAVTGPGHRSGLKVLARPLKGALYTSWYPLMEYEYKGTEIKTTPKQERWQKKLKILRAGGKGPPKKGAGKRSK